MSSTRHSMGFAAATMLAVSFSSSAFGAESAHEEVFAVRSAVVRYDDLNLAGDAGVRALYARLRQAAKRVCGPAEMPLRAAQMRRACYTEALAEAVEAFGNLELKALHEEANGAGPTPRIAALR